MNAPDSTWAGFLVPLVQHWFPQVPQSVLVLVIGFLISVAYAWARAQKHETKSQAAESLAAGPDPVHVAIPAGIGVLLAGVPGILAGAVGDGLRRALWAIGTWIGKLIQQKPAKK